MDVLTARSAASAPPNDKPEPGEDGGLQMEGGGGGYGVGLGGGG
eukprot:COSAG04_NODE_22723_length_350_cov_0.784861_1_plen_43_part_10